MMNIYLRRGYLIIYMAGRPRQMDVLGKSMCQATLDWLEANGFPTDRGDTLLSKQSLAGIRSRWFVVVAGHHCVGSPWRTGSRLNHIRQRRWQQRHSR